MGIVKLFSKHREKNTRTVSLKYDQRRHSSTSYFTASPSIYSIPVDTKMNNRPIDSPNGLVLNRDSALMLNTSGIFPKGTSILSTTGTDIQHTSKPRRKSESKQSNQRSSQYSKRRSTSKVLSMYDLKCTCETPSTSRERNNRASVPILDTAISNKYEFDSKEKSLKDPKNDSQLENGSGAGATGKKKTKNKKQKKKQ
jgi:hypothetical protein